MRVYRADYLPYLEILKFDPINATSFYPEHLAYDKHEQFATPSILNCCLCVCNIIDNTAASCCCLHLHVFPAVTLARALTRPKADSILRSQFADDSAARTDRISLIAYYPQIARKTDATVAHWGQ